MIDLDHVRTSQDLRSPKVRGHYAFLPSNPYNMGVYGLLLTSGSTPDCPWQCLDPLGPPEVPEGPEGTSSFKLKPLQYGFLWIPFDLRVDA